MHSLNVQVRYMQHFIHKIRVSFIFFNLLLYYGGQARRGKIALSYVVIKNSATITVHSLYLLSFTWHLLGQTSPSCD